MLKHGAVIYIIYCISLIMSIVFCTIKLTLTICPPSSQGHNNNIGSITALLMSNFRSSFILCMQLSLSLYECYLQLVKTLLIMILIFLLQCVPLHRTSLFLFCWNGQHVALFYKRRPHANKSANLEKNGILIIIIR